MGMTWNSNVQRGAIALGMLAALAMASGADYFDIASRFVAILLAFFW